MRARCVSDYYGIHAVPGFGARMSNATRAHVPELDGLRGVAIMTVVLGHLLQRVERFYGREALNQIEILVLAITATPFSGCRILFCITGYIFALNLKYGKERNGLIYNSSLMIKISRLWPPYAFILVFTFITIELTGYKPLKTNHFYTYSDEVIPSLIASLIYIHNIIFNSFPFLFPPGWYLEVHVQFLLLAPLLFRPYTKFASENQKFKVGIVAIVVATALAMITSEYGEHRIQYSIIAFLPYFLVGALVAELNDRASIQYLSLQFGPVPLGLLGLTTLILLGAPWGAIWWQLPAQLLAIAAIITACTGGKSRFRAAMSDRNLTRIGIASFSIYLIHLQVLQITVPIVVEFYRDYSFLVVTLICGAIGTSLVLVVAFLFYWLIERPFIAFSLHVKEEFSIPPRSV